MRPGTKIFIVALHLGTRAEVCQPGRWARGVPTRRWCANRKVGTYVGGRSAAALEAGRPLAVPGSAVERDVGQLAAFVQAAEHQAAAAHVAAPHELPGEPKSAAEHLPQ